MKSYVLCKSRTLNGSPCKRHVSRDSKYVRCPAHYNKKSVSRTRSHKKKSHRRAPRVMSIERISIRRSPAYAMEEEEEEEVVGRDWQALAKRAAPALAGAGAVAGLGYGVFRLNKKLKETTTTIANLEAQYEKAGFLEKRRISALIYAKKIEQSALVKKLAEYGDIVKAKSLELYENIKSYLPSVKQTEDAKKTLDNATTKEKKDAEQTVETDAPVSAS